MPDYPQSARKLFESTRDEPISKSLPGLYIVATPIGNLGDITLRALWTLSSVDAIACEDTRISGMMLKRFGIDRPLLPYHDHNADRMRPNLLRRIESGEAIALISDAGMPLIADPGFKLVRACRERNLAVTVVPGANAALAGLASSGLPSDRFFFAGFLPAKTGARRKAIQELKTIPSTLLLYEAPQRIAETLEDLGDILGDNRPAALARELTKKFEETRRGSLAELTRSVTDDPPKGEITLIIGPPGKDQPSAEGLDEQLAGALAEHSLRDAVDLVTSSTGLKKSDVYAAALKQQKTKGRR